MLLLVAVLLQVMMIDRPNQCGSWGVAIGANRFALSLWNTTRSL
ncbi:hypothetical protein [Microcoleus sp. Pol12A5]